MQIRNSRNTTSELWNIVEQIESRMEEIDQLLEKLESQQPKSSCPPVVLSSQF